MVEMGEISAEQIKNFKELSKLMKGARKELPAKRQELFDTIADSIDMDLVEEITSFAGSDSVSVKGKIGEETITFTIRIHPARLPEKPSDDVGYVGITRWCSERIIGNTLF